MVWCTGRRVLFCTGPCPCRCRFVDIGQVVFLVETFKRPKPVAEVRKSVNDSIGLLHETSKASGNDATAEYRKVADRQRQYCLAGCPLPVLYAPDGKARLFEKKTKILVIEQAGVEVRVTRTWVRDAAQERATGPESAANLLQSVVRIHEVLECFEADYYVEGIIGERKTVGADVEALGG